MVESKKVKETEEEKESKELAKKVVEELLTKDGGEGSYNGSRTKGNGNGLKPKIITDPDIGPRGGCP